MTIPSLSLLLLIGVIGALLINVNVLIIKFLISLLLIELWFLFALLFPMLLVKHLMMLHLVLNLRLHVLQIHWYTFLIDGLFCSLQAFRSIFIWLLL